MIYNQLLTISYSTSQTRIVAQRKKNPRIVFVQTYHQKFRMCGCERRFLQK